MNTVNLFGRLTQDPDLRYTQNGTPVANFTVAVDGYNDHTNFIRCVAWQKTAELIGQRVKKGHRIIVEGSWHQDSYENNEGQRVQTNECSVARFSFVETRAEASQIDAKNNNYSQGNVQGGGQPQGVQNQAETPFEETFEINENDIPF